MHALLMVVCHACTLDVSCSCMADLPQGTVLQPMLPSPGSASSQSCGQRSDEQCHVCAQRHHAAVANLRSSFPENMLHPDMLGERDAGVGMDGADYTKVLWMWIDRPYEM